MSRAIQGELWSSDPVAWAELAECRHRPLYEEVAERLNLQPGGSLLDAGCGAGLFAALAAGRGVHVTGLDAAPGLIGYARERVPAADFRVGALEGLPFPDRIFDVVTAFNSVPYAADTHKAITEIARVTAPLGQTALTVGAGAEESSCAAMIDPLAPNEHVPDWKGLNLKDPDLARAAMHKAGLAVVQQFDVALNYRFADLEDAIRAQLPAGPVEAAVRHSGRQRVEHALRDFFEPRVQRDGSVRMRVVFRCVIARVENRTRRHQGTEGQAKNAESENRAERFAREPAS